MDLQLVHDFIEQSNSSNSNNDKLEVLKTYTQPDYITSVQLKKQCLN